ncbi:MAG: ThuA domain-containing protein, partial [Pseudomonadota bacterium]
DFALDKYDAVVLLNTTGDFLDDQQQSELQRFVRAGGGVVGVHAAADAEVDWPWYSDMIGAKFTNHPFVYGPSTIKIEDLTDVSTAGFSGRQVNEFVLKDEIYNFDKSPRDTGSHIILTLDESRSFSMFPKHSMGDDHPISWKKEYDGGRFFYTSLGHSSRSWLNIDFMHHLMGGVRWATEKRDPKMNRIVLTDEMKAPLSFQLDAQDNAYIIELTGELLFWNKTTGNTKVIGKLPVSNWGENGLLGIALANDFETSRELFLYFSEVTKPVYVGESLDDENSTIEGKLTAFKLDSNGMLDMSSRRDLLSVPSEATTHQGGALMLSKENHLYLATGDDTVPFASNDLSPLDQRPGREQYNALRSSGNPHDLRGKLLRLNVDGSIPDGNSYDKSGVNGRPEVYATGFRNPFSATLDPDTGHIYVGDVGPDGKQDVELGPQGYDEVNVVTRAGLDFGWPRCAGARKAYAIRDFVDDSYSGFYDCSKTEMPIYEYTYLFHKQFPSLAIGSRVVIAGRFMSDSYFGRKYSLPESYRGKLITGEWGRNRLHEVTVGDDGRATDLKAFAPSFYFASPIDLQVASDGALYVLEYGSSYGGDSVDAKLSRIEYSNTKDFTPSSHIVSSINKNEGVSVPYTLKLSGLGSLSPNDKGNTDNGISTYSWTIKGQDVDVQSSDSHFEYVLKKPGTYSASLVTENSSGNKSFPAVKTFVLGNQRPVVKIVSPVMNQMFLEGAKITLKGEVTDPDDASANCADLVWDVRLGHGRHAHPLFLKYGCEAEFDAVHLDRDHGDELFYFVELRYTDKGDSASGVDPLTTTQRIDLYVKYPETEKKKETMDK